MGGGLPADCGKENIGFPTPFRAVIKGRHRLSMPSFYKYNTTYNFNENYKYNFH